MPVYIDDFDARFGRMIMCHMIADTKQELLDMATKIGVQHKWIQHEGTAYEHFDVSKYCKKLAIQNGTTEVGMRVLAAAINRMPGTTIAEFIKQAEDKKTKQKNLF